jgi:hypothetical protein
MTFFAHLQAYMLYLIGDLSYDFPWMTTNIFDIWLIIVFFCGKIWLLNPSRYPE